MDSVLRNGTWHMAHGTLISMIGGYRLTLLQQVGWVTR